MWKVGAFKAVAPAVLVRDRWVGPREQVLNVRITCRSLSFPHCLIDYCGREAGYGPVDQMDVELWIMSGALLLWGSGSVQIC
jgi:hypothetical protein